MGRVGCKIKMKKIRAYLSELNLTPKLFDNIERNDSTPKRNNEKDFDFYNRSASKEIGRVRDTMTSFLSNYPTDEVKDLVLRLRSGDDEHFRSASFELFLNEILVRLGFSVRAHPELHNGSRKRPDFLVCGKDGKSFYLEAILAKENNEKDLGGEARKSVVLDKLNGVPHKSFMIVIEESGSPKSPPSCKKLISQIHNWLDSLNVSEFISKDIYSVEPFIWDHDGWELVIYPYLNNPEHKSPRRLIACYSGDGSVVDAWTPIRKAIRTKGHRYGELDLPFVVAVNFDRFNLNPIDEVQALFGQEQIVVKRDSDEPARLQRIPNGAWYGENGPQYRRVSGVWLFNDLMASQLASRRSVVYFNPWAYLPAPELLKTLPHAEVVNNQIQRKDGLTLRDIYGLPQDWPETPQ
ncbi:hypothetical protein NTK89_001823 [Vibrio fluvialis]|nr:hypothetical protein [Vibrio fluvialis]